MALSVNSIGGCDSCATPVAANVNRRFTDNGNLRKAEGADAAERPDRPDRPGRPERLTSNNLSATSTSELKFQVRTAEGDTVTLSVNAVQNASQDELSYESGDGSLQAGQSVQNDTLSASLSVEGDLSDAELADITKALEGLSQGQSVEGLQTIASAEFAYSSRTVYTQSQFSYLG